MAELAAVGVAANILQLIDFGSRAITRLEEFHAYVDEVPYTFISVKHQLPLLLDTLKKTQDAIGVGMIKRETDAALGAVIRDCMLQIQSLEAILLKILPTSQDSWLKRSKKAISSFNQDSAVQKISSKIRHHVQVLTYYHAAQTMPNPEKDNELMEIRHWLAAPDPSINYKQALRVRHDDTGLWFLENEHYLEWKDTSTPSLLYLYGIPGCGKTVLSSTVIQDMERHCQKELGQAVAYFYLYSL